MKLNRDEILRYMRMKSAKPDAVLSARIDALEKEVLAAARPVSKRMRVEVREDAAGGGASRYVLGSLALESNDLRRCLGEAKEAYLFAATLGHDVDRLIRKYAALSAADLLIVQAIAATAIEQYIDDETASWGEKLLPRFSPGYGDLPLSVQREFLATLDPKGSLGITLTETFLMIPSKSVTAIIGVLS